MAALSVLKIMSLMTDYIRVFLVRISGHRYYVKFGHLDEFLSSVSFTSSDSYCEISVDYVLSSRFSSDETFKFV